MDQIGATSLMTAALRARETDRPDRICADPYAVSFIRAVGHGLPPHADGFVEHMAEQVAVRTRFLDDALLEAAAGGRDQVVLVACGMDSRVFRLDWPAGGTTELTVFEVDQAPVLAFKDVVLAAAAATPHARRRTVGVDLRDDWVGALLTAGFDASRPAAWLTEGLLYALDEPAADTLLDRITTASAPGSTIAFDHLEASPSFRTALREIDPALDALWRGGPGDPGQWLSRHGWNPEVHELADIAADHGRSVHPSFDPGRADSTHNWLVTATL
ncbi:SAM-dependent methyltransferase [Actinomycetospora sp. CA-101289]|uniref:SAM-dependent methyltransferase n=1 Tax=Actinomycetospora sp. CA-101289 TaxID=3239893 RepID=UPI003D994AC8